MQVAINVDRLPEKWEFDSLDRTHEDLVFNCVTGLFFMVDFCVVGCVG